GIDCFSNLIGVKGNAARLAAIVATLKYPITGIAGCWACALADHAAAPSPTMNSRRRIPDPRAGEGAYRGLSCMGTGPPERPTAAQGPFCTNALLREGGGARSSCRRPGAGISYGTQCRWRRFITR